MPMNGLRGGGGGGNHPKLQIQPATPVPTATNNTNTRIPTICPSNGLGYLSDEKGNLPKIVPSLGSVSSRSSNCHVGSMGPPQMPPPGAHSQRGLLNSSTPGRYNRPIKSDPMGDSYGLHCAGMNMRHSQVPNLGVGSHGNTSSFGQNIGVSNQYIQANAPTPSPSDISSLHGTPRNSEGTPSYTASLDGSDKNNARLTVDQKDMFLIPSHNLKQEPWQHGYKVLPRVASSVSAMTSEGSPHHLIQLPHHNGFIPHGSSSLSVSPLALPDMFADYNMTSQSARQAKKRAMSTSTLSSEGLDILNMIRYSPTALFHCGSAGSNPDGRHHQQVSGYGHLSARNSSGSPGSGSMATRFSKDLDNNTLPAYFASSQLENGQGLNLSLNMNTNQMVIQQDLLSYMDMFPDDIQVPSESLFGADDQHVQLPSASISSSLPCEGASLVDGMPPPPPYHQAIQGNNQQQQHHHHHHQHHQQQQQQQQQQQNSPDQKQDNVISPSSVKNVESSCNGGEKVVDSEDEENCGQHGCKWIDCNMVFSEQDELVRHLEKQHIDQRRGEEFTCFWSGCQRRYKPFNARYKLLIHMRVHSGEKPNKCTYEGCNKEFSRLENLKIHLRWHSGEKPYQCQHPACSKTFTNPSDRSKHQRTHKDPKPYACPVASCNKRYTDPSSLRKHQKSHDNKDQARKKVRKEGIVEYGTTSGTEVLGPCLNVQKVRSGSEKDVHEQDMFLPGMQFGHALYAMNNHQVISEPPVLPPGMGPSDLDHRTRVGGGYNAAPNGALLGPSRRIIPPIDVQRQQSNNVGTSLQVNKIGANGMHMPSPGSFQQDTMSPQEQQWSQPSSQSAVPTPSPRETMLVAAEQSPQAGGLPDSVAGGTSPFLPSPRPYTLPPQQEFQHLQVPVHRMSHVNYVPQAGNAPLMNDYAGMPCNLQERMSFGQHNGHTFHMPLSLEETLANLPYDAIQLQRALSNHSGSV